MANLPTQNFSTLVANAAATAQGRCASLLNLTPGSALRAIFEASASIGVWLEYLILQVLAKTRLSTSRGSDIDSFVADFGMTRLGATFATGSITMYSLSPASQSGTVQIGALVRTADASLTYAVIQDTANPAWSPAAGAYIRPVGTPSITVPIQCQVAGTTGNVSAGAINLLGTAISGIDTVTNLLAITDASDVETDAALQARFPVFINTRSQATLLAIEYAVESVQAAIIYQIVANVDAQGNALPGNIVVYVDDGSGSPPQTLLSAVYAAVDPVRPIATSLSVVPPTVIPAAVVMAVQVSTGYTPSSVAASVSAAITAYINAIGIGGTLSYSRLISIAYTVAGVANVTGTTLNGGTLDLAISAGQVVRTSSVQIATD